MSNTQISPGTLFKTFVLKDLLYNVIAPYILYVFLKAQHFPTLMALLLASIPPILTNLLAIVRWRKVNLLGILAVIGIATSIFSLLLLKDARLSFVGGSLTTGIYGVLLIASVLFTRPLLFMIALDFVARNDPAQQEKLKQNTRFLSFMRYLTLIWGSCALVQFIINIALVFVLTVQQMLLIPSIIHYGLLGLGAALTLVLVYLRKRGKVATPAIQEASGSGSFGG